MKIYREIFSPIQVNTYIITGNNKECIIIDCGCYNQGEENKLEHLITEKGLEPVMLLNTHCHLDHIFGNLFMSERYGLKTLFNENDRYNYTHAPEQAKMFGLSMKQQPEPAGYLCDGESVSAAGLDLTVMTVPGHSPGGVAFYSEDDGIVFTGDTLFAGGIGRSDLYGGNHRQLLESIRTRLFTLPPETLVYPGHGPETTIKKEKDGNPFFF